MPTRSTSHKDGLGDGLPFLKAYRWSLIWAAIILVLCLIPGDALPQIDFWQFSFEDKIAHFAVFAILAVLMVAAEQRRLGRERIGWASKLLIILVAIAFGWLTEQLQFQFIPGRYGSVGDVIADAIGAIIGIVLAPYLLRKFRRRYSFI